MVLNDVPELSPAYLFSPIRIEEFGLEIVSALQFRPFCNDLARKFVYAVN